MLTIATRTGSWHATLRVVEGGGHLFLLNHVAESAAAIQAFLDGVAPRPRR